MKGSTTTAPSAFCINLFGAICKMMSKAHWSAMTWRLFLVPLSQSARSQRRVGSAEVCLLVDSMIRHIFRTWLLIFRLEQIVFM